METGKSWPIDQFWLPNMGVEKALSDSKIKGWYGKAQAKDEFVEPRLSLIDGDPETSKIFIISAPGAVGKSTLASILSNKLNFALIDLSITTPLGGNFFKGGLANAFGFDALQKAADGKIGMIVDGLDEAQLRAAPNAFEAALADLAEIAVSPNAKPVILLGRAVAADDAAAWLMSANFDVCQMAINFFDEEKALAYMKAKSKILAARSTELMTAYENHFSAFHDLARETRERLKTVNGGDDIRFSGYAPVLDAICEFVLDPEKRNPAGRVAEVKGGTQIELVNSLADAILIREQRKLLGQLREKLGENYHETASKLYSIEEQKERVLARILGLQSVEVEPILDVHIREAYSEMVARFIPQHPFLDANGTRPANLVFAAYLFVWALRNGELTEETRKFLSGNVQFASGILFDLYFQEMSAEQQQYLPMSEVGLLYQALQSQMTARQRVLLDVSSASDDMDDITVVFEVIEADNALGEKIFGPYKGVVDAPLDLKSPFSNVYIDAPIFLSLGDGAIQQIGAPVEISVSELTIAAKQIFVHGSKIDNSKDALIVFMSAGEADCMLVQSVSVSGATLAVSWPNDRHHPWTSYIADLEPPASPDLSFMRRRLRKILTSFRSHSKGALVRFAPKIDALRMTKDARGKNLVRALIDDGILSKVDMGKFYVLHPDKMAEFLGIDYHALQQQRYVPHIDVYLESVIRRYPSN
ncbi:hypothetical protein MVG78_18755 [Roseomonas gilardii subsp. gilardii]|uniref:hypothetical protein n=1 Tax=Roseomonas gilardii TaxID=257708 RepID=UPI001FF8A1BB|nr:hypothetical protein [Roseomonas gilardii]UPG72492.1 hypothetical protein MVG78_18755 [Roseomonas gilardii subsp. gilardii]